MGEVPLSPGGSSPSPQHQWHILRQLNWTPGEEKLLQHFSASPGQAEKQHSNIWRLPHAVHPGAQRNKHFPFSLKRSKQFLFISGSWGVSELNQQLFKTLNALENTGDLKSIIPLKKGKCNINPNLRSKGTSSRWCYVFLPRYKQRLSFITQKQWNTVFEMLI